MFKFATALLVSIVAANDITIGQIPLQNYLSKDLVKNMISTLRIKANGLHDTGKVSYSQCDDETGSFQLDTSSTYNSPDPLTKGIDISFVLAGILSDDIHVDNVHIHVDWNGSPLYDEDHKDAVKDFSDSFNMKLGWSVPSYAPDGNYAVKLVGTNASTSKTNLCVDAAFTF